jgi:thermostable 8-oxoguanine DNA glycosylase
VKDAKSEAQKEIEDYRTQKDSEFKTFETEVNQNTANALATCLLYPNEFGYYEIHDTLNTG